MEVNNEAIDWENLLNLDIPEDLDMFFDAPDTGAESWMGELEELLMKDDDVVDGVTNDVDLQVSDFQVSDLLVDFAGAEGPEVVDKNSNLPSSASSPSIGNGNGNGNEGGSPNFESDGNENYKSDGGVIEVNDDEDDDDENDDPATKKRKRQLRNRDAAMRSRERKKMYVKDLEMKSRYLEEECRRLKRQLDFCYYVNQDLYHRLHSGSAYGAFMTKPESAVLLLESLLLGSLVWFMFNLCLLLQPRLPLLSQDAAILVSVDLKEQGSAAPKRKGTKTNEFWIALSFMRGKRCKASRTKMKSHFEHDVLCN